MKKVTAWITISTAILAIVSVDTFAVRGVRGGGDFGGGDRGFTPRAGDNNYNSLRETQGVREDRPANAQRYDNSQYISQRRGNAVEYNKYYVNGTWYYPRAFGPYTAIPVVCNSYRGYGYLPPAGGSGPTGWVQVGCGYWAPSAGGFPSS